MKLTNCAKHVEMTKGTLCYMSDINIVFHCMVTKRHVHNVMQPPVLNHTPHCGQRVIYCLPAMSDFARAVHVDLAASVVK